MIATRIQFMAAALMVGVGPSAWATVYVAVPAGGPAAPGIFALTDLNADGDAGDGGERRTFRNGSGGGVSTTLGFVDVAAGTAGTVYAIDPVGDRIFALTDLDGDGDAQSASEVAVLYQSISVDKARLTALAVGPVWDEDDGIVRDAVFAFDPAAQSVYRFVDWNGDGVLHPESVDEVAPYHTLSSQEPFTAQKLAAGPFGFVYGTLTNDEAVARLWSSDGDGALDPPEDTTPDNCTVDEAYGAKEYLTLRQDDPGLKGETGITRLGSDTVLVSIPAQGGQDVATIWWLRDGDGDEDSDQSGEFGLWTRLMCSSAAPGLLMLNPSDIVAIKGGRVIAADYNEDRLLWFEDRNADGDAMDSGECGLYASGLVYGFGLATEAALPADVSMALSGAAVSDEGKGPEVSVAWGGSASVTATVVDASTGAAVADVPVRCDVLSGCLSCDGRIQRTNSAGQVSFTVSHGAPEPLTAGGELMLTAAGGQTLSFSATWPILKVVGEDGNPLTNIDFGSVAAGETASALLLVSNVGSEALSGEAVSDTAEFVVSGSPFALDEPGAPTVVEVAFSPVVEGDFDGYVTLDGGGSYEIYVKGTASPGGGGCEGARLFPALLILPLVMRRRR